MPEYLAPGVFVEEVSFRAKSIEGVPTSTTGFVGLARFGPVHRTGGPTTVEPRLVTSFTEFERAYGGLEPLAVGGDERANYLAHAARAFFLNGGKRLYVSRVFAPNGGADTGVASLAITVAPGHAATWTARWPGAMGNARITTSVHRSKNVAFQDTNLGTVQAKRAKAGAIVEIYNGAPPATLADDDPPDATRLHEVQVDVNGKQTFHKLGGGGAVLAGTDVILLLELRVLVEVDDERRDFYADLGAHPDQTRYIGKIFDADNPEDEDSLVSLTWDPSGVPDAAAKLMVALTGDTVHRLTGGNDGAMPGAVSNPPGAPSFLGEEADPDDATKKAHGLAALGEIDDIAIVAIPDAAKQDPEDRSFTIHDGLLAHCQTLKYRIAVVDGPPHASMNRVREYRGRFDSKYGAFYHPWIEILDPLERPSQGAPPGRLTLPPSGFVCGIYARSDIERGVHKAPANEVVNGLTKFEININKGRQEVLNPEGINALRFFEGRGNRVWGARTMSSDPEWKYVNVRRLFIYLEHSVDKATQWAVFEPNNERLWANVRREVEDFLLVLWKDGALLGEKPEQAFFVRCDRTTMTQNDLDNGRLIVLVGVAPTKPAEFVIFRVGQFTADAKL